MASVRILDGGFDLEHRSVPVRRFLAGVAIYLNAISEGSAAAHEYEELTRRGTPHEDAIARVFEKHFRRR